LLRAYDDIISRLGPCKWFDGQGVPRYEDFHPDLCDIYNCYVAYLEIACQSCDKRFFVASEMDFMDMHSTNFTLPLRPLNGNEKKINEVERKLDGSNGSISPWEQIASFHYGDPPRHDDCLSGVTMNSVPIRIIEFWKKDAKGFNWVRDPDYEFVLSRIDHDKG
jgi:hypothetical protein